MRIYFLYGTTLRSSRFALASGKVPISCSLKNVSCTFPESFSKLQDKVRYLSNLLCPPEPRAKAGKGWCEVAYVFLCFALLSAMPSFGASKKAQFINKPDAHGERHIVILTASYNNKDWYKWNLDSIFAQDYQNYRIIYIDDFSTDGTAQLVEDYIKEKGQQHRVTLIKNIEHKGAVANHYYAIHSCPDKSIIAIVDGDDAIAHPGVLNYLNRVYSDNNIWLTYGQFMEFPGAIHGFCCPMPEDVVKHNAFRDFVHIPSHMRTFYAGLYKQIKKEDLMYQGQFLEMLADIAAMFPMIEMARDHFKFIPDILYHYNGANVINDHKKSKKMQRDLDLMVRARPRYDKVKSPIVKKK